jgi:hypothetical protein
MRISAFRKTRRWQGGGAAVELAVCLPVMIMFLAVPLFFARFCWHYTVTQKAARDAARYLSSVPKIEILARKTPLEEIDAALLTKSIAAIETSELNPGPSGLYIEAICDGSACLGVTTPKLVRARITTSVVDTIFPGLTSSYGGTDGITYAVEVTMPYVGH